MNNREQSFNQHLHIYTSWPLHLRVINSDINFPSDMDISFAGSILESYVSSTSEVLLEYLHLQKGSLGGDMLCVEKTYYVTHSMYYYFEQIRVL